MKINSFELMQKTNMVRPGFFISSIFFLLLLAAGCKKIGNEPVSDSTEALSHSSSDKMKAIDKKLIADNFISPLGVVSVPEPGKRKGHEGNDHGNKKHDKRLFVIDQAGYIWIIDEHGNRLASPFLDLKTKIVPLNPFYDERGLLGFAFHPDYLRNGRFFVYYNAPPRAGGPAPGRLWNNLSKIVEFRVSRWNPNMADISTERPLLEIDDPQSNHNGGTIAFGPKDEYLYVAIGDGGGANDVGPSHVEDWYPENAGGNGQDIEANLFGNILRLDVNHGMPYGIPRDNPFVGKTGRDEIFAFGFRNPFRFSFDMEGNHDLYAGDAGQVLYEEVDVVTKGGNYGWNVKEGTHCFNAANNTMELPSCPAFDNLGNRLIDPVIELNNFRNPKGGRATTIIGGNVYRGDKISFLRGKYIFGTFSQTPQVPNGEIFMAQPGGSGLWSFQEISLKSSPNDIGYYLKGFGQDRKGEIYLAVSSMLGPTGNTGKIFKLVKAERENDDDDD